MYWKMWRRSYAKNVNFLIGLSVEATDCTKEVRYATDEWFIK